MVGSGVGVEGFRGAGGGGVRGGGQRGAIRLNAA